MDVIHDTNDEQARMWNGPSGRAWVENQDLLDRMYEPFEDLLVEAASAKSARAVLDVGCGAGATTLAVARALGAAEAAPYVQGADISEPLIAAARARAEREGASGRVHLRQRADVSLRARALRPDHLALRRDVLRRPGRGVREPAACRARRRRASGDRLAQRRASNPFMTTAERAAAPLLPNLPPRRPNAPGQFAFADEGRVRAILDESGWSRHRDSPDRRRLHAAGERSSSVT